MKKRLITMLKSILAMLAVLLLGLTMVNPAHAETPAEEIVTEPAPYASVALELNQGSIDSGKFFIVLSANEGGYFVVYTNGIPGRGYVETERPNELQKYAELGFAGLAPGTTVKGCLRVDFQTDEICSVLYTVPIVHTIPDTDKDGVADNIDLCSNTPVGTAVDGNGCPVVVPVPVDTDLDGVPNDIDNCDNDAGPASNGGCPVDTDGDGVIDHIDNCDNEAGPASNGGCPVVVPEPVDTDGDNVNDDVDNCDNEAGPASNGGCPVVVDDQVCAEMDSGKIDTTGDPLTVVLTAPEGMVITGYCVKAGSAKQGEGPEYPALTPDQLNQNSITIAHSSGKAISHYSFSYGPAPVVDACPEIDDVQAPGTDCTPVVVPDACPPGMGWKDTNGNNKVDEGECVKRVPPISGPPVVVPPVVVPPVVTPPVIIPPVVVPSVVVPDESSVVSDDESTNGRGFRVETAVTADPRAVSAEPYTTYGAGIAGFVVLMLIAAAARRTREVSSK